jgi:carbonic anhydrase
MDRRRFLQTAGSGLAAAVAAPLFVRAEGATEGPRRSASTPEAAIELLRQGNTRYAAGNNGSHDFSAERGTRAMGQKPFAAILSCADSRVAPELIFDAQPGELFVCRDAGNFATGVTTASLEYGQAVLGVQVILVLGHSACGAVDATIKVVETGEALPGHLPLLTDAITPAVERVQKASGDLLDNAIASNVRLNVEALSTSDPILAPAVQNGKLAVIGGVYQIDSGEVVLLR